MQKNIEGQQSLFDNDSTETLSRFELVKEEDPGGRPEEKLKCHRMEYVGTEDVALADLFSGFDQVRAITFSYSINFIEKIMTYFQYGEIILGADFMVNKNRETNALIVEVLTNAEESLLEVKKHGQLVQMMNNSDLRIHTATSILDHRKVYLLNTDDGKKTRVITASANMTEKAWNNDHLESYQFCDTPEYYREWRDAFETAWSLSSDIEPSVIASKETDDPAKGNPILKGIKETETAAIIRETEPEITLENVRYAIEHEKTRAKYKELLRDVKFPRKDGIYKITPENVRLIERNRKKILQKKVTIENKMKEYPSLQIDYATGKVRLMDKLLDLNPDKESICNDASQLLNLFSNFDDFVGDVEKLKESHFKLINLMFSSVFNAKMRCEAQLAGKSTSALPLTALLLSRTENNGKTFMVETALKMMTGLDKLTYSKAEIKQPANSIEDILNECKGVPVFIDEVDNSFLTRIKDIIIHPEMCESKMRYEQPLLIFAGNKVDEQDGIRRKRMVILRFESALPSSIDTNAYKSQGDALKRKLGTAFYREYLRRMIAEVNKMLEFISSSKEIPDTWYPELMKISSETILEIFADCGLETPEFMRTLSWVEDYAPNARFIAQDTLDEICALYKKDRRRFTIGEKTIIIEVGTGNEGKKRCESWVKILPPEMQARDISIRDSYKIEVDRKELVEKTGIKVRKNVFRRR